MVEEEQQMSEAQKILANFINKLCTWHGNWYELVSYHLVVREIQGKKDKRQILKREREKEEGRSPVLGPVLIQPTGSPGS